MIFTQKSYIMSPPSAFAPVHVVPPQAPHPHTHTIIALHGRGSQGPEFADELFGAKTSSGLNLRDSFPSWKWVFPSSQKRHSTVFQEELDEWFDIYSLTDPSQREDLQIEGLRDSIAFLREVIREETKAVPLKNVMLLGLSQGSATGLLTLLACQLQIGAFIGLNGWMPFKLQIEQAKQDNLVQLFENTLGFPIEGLSPNRSDFDTPVFLGHTLDDEVVDLELGQQARDGLMRLGMKVTWAEHKEGGHLGLLDTKGLDDISAFLTGVYRP